MTAPWCASSPEAQALSDDDFWANVYGDQVGDDEGWPPDTDLDTTTTGPCPECGEAGACAWDVYGRPLIHAVTADESDE